MLDQYRDYLLTGFSDDCLSGELNISSSGNIRCQYAPFEHVNGGARVVLLGITPGSAQATTALQTLRSELQAGTPDELALERAKNTASFSGPMRSNLIAMLDDLGINSRLGLETTGSLFSDRSDLVHFTSAVRNPVFVDGKN